MKKLKILTVLMGTVIVEIKSPTAGKILRFVFSLQQLKMQITK